MSKRKKYTVFFKNGTMVQVLANYFHSSDKDNWIRFYIYSTNALVSDGQVAILPAENVHAVGETDLIGYVMPAENDLP